MLRQMYDFGRGAVYKPSERSAYPNRRLVNGAPTKIVPLQRLDASYLLRSTVCASAYKT
jgi:hypothetical protein